VRVQASGGTDRPRLGVEGAMPAGAQLGAGPASALPAGRIAATAAAPRAGKLYC
jgi:hypothetical protein